MLEIQSYRFDFEREPLSKPFQFKGGGFTEKWVLITSLVSRKGTRATGLGGLAVLWSDPEVFFAYSEAGGNVVMAAMAEKALKLLAGKSFASPVEVLEFVFPEVHEFGKYVTGNERLTKTFTLNSLVSLDLALWTLVFHENHLANFDELIPEEFRGGLASRQQQIARVPVISYNTSREEIFRLADSGHFFFKIKLGQPGTAAEMLEKDETRLKEVHDALGPLRTPHTRSGKIQYYLDVNGRYPDRATLRRLVDFLERAKILEQVAILEEPFPPEVRVDVSDLPLCLAADESLHDVSEVIERVHLGYKAMAIKPAGKTLSKSFQMAQAAHERGIPCFVADSACIPLLLEWNKNVAARLGPFPGLGMGIIESHGEQTYRNWGSLLAELPFPDGLWVASKNGVYHLDEDFYQKSGGIFLPPGHYQTVIGGTR
ncbi:MAG TPA: enolase C-terminal domain-like protein [Thermodesulfobacteriota bacterium]|nr:enolase C-terminal domain-like protein [Thermodesulfobacteriota bacterium]